jgi:hypothetical protein
MLKALEERLPAGVRWSRPEGGFFLWLTLPDGMDADRLLEEAMREKVMFVPGSCYYANGGGACSLRLNFSAYDEQKLARGVDQAGAGDRARRGAGMKPEDSATRLRLSPVPRRGRTRSWPRRERWPPRSTDRPRAWPSPIR